MSRVEGYVPFRGLRTWYRVVGDGEEPGKLPVLCLHGGPGATHDYLESLEALAETGRRAIFYDQVGCGRSDLGDKSLWTVETYVEEVGAVRRELGLDRVHVFGNSWGGMLGMEYALTQPDGLASLVVASSPASMRQWVAEANRLRAELPEDVQRTLEEHEAAGTTDSAEYEEACEVFYRRHVCRVEEWPDSVLRSFQWIAEHGEVYRYMNGPSEFHVVGTIKDWDITARLGEIRVPTLVVSGEFDEATPAINRTVSEGIPRAESVIYGNASHMAHVEDTAGYVALLDGFFSRVEAA
ncbi:MAG: proline iminopeptidase-family hydrolase [Actinobacteria bacterium]|nr:proline iminopeptidase-family hydrolase [Actinomycetota bacterium]